MIFCHATNLNLKPALNSFDYSKEGLGDILKYLVVFTILYSTF